MRKVPGVHFQRPDLQGRSNCKHFFTILSFTGPHSELNALFRLRAAIPESIVLDSRDKAVGLIVVQAFCIFVNNAVTLMMCSLDAVKLSPSGPSPQLH